MRRAYWTHPGDEDHPADAPNNAVPWFALLPDSDDDDDSNGGMDGPVELADGRLVCKRHAQALCHRCGVDYSLMEDVLDPEREARELDREMEEKYWSLSPESRAEIDARWGPPPNGRPAAASEPSSSTTTSYATLKLSEMEKIRGTGKGFSSQFTTTNPNINPDKLFCRRSRLQNDPTARFIHANEAQMLIYTDGACLANGQAGAKAGWAFTYGPGIAVAGRLEVEGPFGDVCDQTSNRAELRAVLAALRCRDWSAEEGLDGLVIAVDSEYVAKGATMWVRSWVEKGWKTSKGEAVKNRDLWELLLGDVERYKAKKDGFKVEFWSINRDMNKVADAAAKNAAKEEDVAKWEDRILILPAE